MDGTKNTTLKNIVLLFKSSDGRAVRLPDVRERRLPTDEPGVARSLRLPLRQGDRVGRGGGDALLALHELVGPRLGRGRPLQDRARPQ